MSFRSVSLRAQEGWQWLEKVLSKKQAKERIVRTLIQQLRDLAAVSVLVEEDYLDRDFSEAYSAYYARTFRRHSKRCTRLLFFASDLDFLNDHDVRSVATRLEQAPYLGEIVLRPIAGAPIALAILKTPAAPKDLHGQQLVFATYKAHVLGAELSVDAAPMTQQDSRTGSCAQATIWVVARHFHMRHRGPWISTVSITQSAVIHAESAIASHLPAGSESLTVNNMIAALRAAGREPLMYFFKSGTKQIRAADTIMRYIDSGIPVIVGLKRPELVGHAIVVTGQLQRKTPRTKKLSDKPTIAEFCDSFYAVDDQIGPNVRVPIRRPTKPSADMPYSIADVQYLIVSLPGKVYLPAERAEEIAWSSMRRYTGDWADFKSRHQGKLGSSVELGDRFVTEFEANRVLARTYLTFGWKYKARGIRNSVPNPVRQAIRSLELPRFVYVTEFSFIDDISGKENGDKRIVAHCIVDATAKNHDEEAVLFIYAPGFLKLRAHESLEELLKRAAASPASNTLLALRAHEAAGDLVERVAAVADSTSYFPKERGDLDFKIFSDDDNRIEQLTD